MSMFENVTRSKLKDCFEMNDTMYYVVEPGQLRQALGKDAENVRTLSTRLNRKIKIVEFNPEILRFIQNLAYPLRIEQIKQEGNIVSLSSEDMKTKGLLIGRNGQNLRNMENIVNRYFKIDEIKVVNTWEKRQED